MAERHLYILAEQGNDSKLKMALNAAVGSLFQAAEDYLRPHVCLNGRFGVAILQRIADDPSTQTEFSIFSRLAYESAGDVWLNVSFVVRTGDIVLLTPPADGLHRGQSAGGDKDYRLAKGESLVSGAFPAQNPDRAGHSFRLLSLVRSQSASSRRFPEPDL